MSKNILEEHKLKFVLSLQETIPNQNSQQFVITLKIEIYINLNINTQAQSNNQKYVKNILKHFEI